MTRLIAVPNVSEGRDEAVLDAIGAAFATHADVLHRSADADHHRAVFFLAGAPGELHLALAAGAAAAAKRIDLAATTGSTRAWARSMSRRSRSWRRRERGAVIAEALLAADAIGAAGVPVFLDGERRAGARAPSCAGRAGRTPGRARDRTTAARAAPAAGARSSPPRAADRLLPRAGPPAMLEDARRIAAHIAQAASRAARRAALGPGPGAPYVVEVSTNIEDHRASRGRRPGRRGGPPRGPRRRARRTRAGGRARRLARALICACRRRSRHSWGRYSSQAHGPDQRTPFQAPGQCCRHHRGRRRQRPQAHPRRSAQARGRREERRSPSRRGAAPPCAPASGSVMPFACSSPASPTRPGDRVATGTPLALSSRSRAIRSSIRNPCYEPGAQGGHQVALDRGGARRWSSDRGWSLAPRRGRVVERPNPL